MPAFSGVKELRGPALWRFVRHYAEMVAAMFIGMGVLAPLWWPLSRGPWPELQDRIELHTLVMATNMTIGMTAWMRFRGHTWRPIAEMAAAMYLPFILLFGPLWAGLITDDTVMMAGHVLMLAAMLLVMLARPREYSHSHHRDHASRDHAEGSQEVPRNAS